jgi:CubicO group peptidase (beta-lactamase class C family)
MTKVFTQIAIRQLAQAGRLALSDTVGKYLPEYPNPVVRARVTIEQLLQHRSGLGHFWNERYAARRTDVRSVNDYLQLFQDDSLLFEPGTRQQYSNSGYVVLGAIIERVSGQSYHEYLADHVFRPSGMTQTTPYDQRALPANAAMGYTRMSDGGRRSSGARRPNTDSKPGLSGPAGDHYSTVGDLHKLATALTAHRLLDSTHTAALLGPRYAAGAGFRAAGGGPGVNAELSVYPSSFIVVVLSNYDPPAATEVAQFVGSLITTLPLANARDRR